MDSMDVFNTVETYDPYHPYAPLLCGDCGERHNPWHDCTGRVTYRVPPPPHPSTDSGTTPYTQDDYNVALGIGMLAGLMVGSAIGFILCAILVRVMGI
jgi:hypothetical protein